jgi:hypothetical protein
MCSAERRKTMSGFKPVFLKWPRDDTTEMMVIDMKRGRSVVAFHLAEWFREFRSYHLPVAWPKDMADPGTGK